MNSTNALPDKIERRPCELCGIDAPVPLMRELSASTAKRYVCRNEIACRKRQRRVAIQTRAAIENAENAGVIAKGV